MLLVALLVCTLGLATILAYEAHDAARSHRAKSLRKFRLLSQTPQPKALTGSAMMKVAFIILWRGARSKAR